MWILLILTINFQYAPTMVAVEFKTKAACVSAATNWQKTIAMQNEYSARRDVSIRTTNLQSVVMCTVKGD